jgi:ABC-type nitrate/sulfonate/bicarbonate transport system substrate-binding protein
MRIFGWAAAVGIAAALLTGCGNGGDSESKVKQAPEPAGASPAEKLPEVRVSLDGYVGVENVGIVMAGARGYFEDVGLSVWSGRPVEPSRPVEYVADGTVDIGITQLPQAVLAKEEGTPIVAVGSLLPRPTAAMIWLEESGIRKMADLKGKTVAVPGVPFQKGLLQAVLARAGLGLEDVTVKNARYGLAPALISGRADAIFGGAWNLEGAMLEARGLDPVIVPVRRLGVPAYDELVVIVKARRASRSPQLIRDFMSAVARGTAAAAEDPAGAIDEIEEDTEKDFSLSRKALEAQLAATLPLLSRTGYMSPGRASGLVEWMREQGLIQKKPRASELLTNRYLAPPP